MRSVDRGTLISQQVWHEMTRTFAVFVYKFRCALGRNELVTLICLIKETISEQIYVSIQVVSYFQKSF